MANIKEPSAPANGLDVVEIKPETCTKLSDDREIPVNTSTLIVGGGIAGIQAALEIADTSHRVYLVERSPSIGGHLAQFDRVFPTMDSTDSIFRPLMKAVGSHR